MAETVTPGDGAKIAEAAQATGKAPSSAKNAAGDYNASTQIKDWNHLERIAPELAKAMKEGIALTTIRQMEDHTKRMKKIHDESRRQ